MNLQEGIKTLEELKTELSNDFNPSRELSLINTKLEDVIIYINAYKDKLTSK